MGFQEAADAFRGAIDAASSMYAEKLVSQQMIDDALAALNEASAAFANQAKPGLKDERVKVEKPAAASGLVYNGLAQTGVQASEGFVLSGAEGKDAGDYVATATLKDGFTWADGHRRPGRGDVVHREGQAGGNVRRARPFRPAPSLAWALRSRASWAARRRFPQPVTRRLP